QATTTSNVGLRITSTTQGISLAGLTSCTQALETDANGNIICGTDQAGGASFGQTLEVFNSGAYLAPTTSIAFVAPTTLGVATTSPWARLSLGTHDLAPTTPSFVIASSSTGVATSTQFIVRNGFVGIGTSSPLALLSINPTNLLGTAPIMTVGSSTQTVFSIDNAGSTTVKNLLFTDTGANGIFWNMMETPNNDLSIYYPSVRRAVLINAGTGGGMLGVGTSSANGFATIVAASSTPSIAITDSDAATDRKHWLLSGSDGQFSIGTTTDTFTATSSPFRITTTGTTTVTQFAVSTLNCSAAGSLVQTNEQGQFVCGTDDGGSVTPQGATGAVQFNNGGAFGGNTGGMFFDSTNMRLGLGSTTPWASLSIQANSGSTTFAIGSSTRSYFVVGNDGRVGVGTSTPMATLSVVGGNGTYPAFVVSTTTGNWGAGHRPLLWAAATTTGALDYARVAIGTTSPWGNSGLRDQLTVDGRIYSTWRYAACDFANMSMTAVLAALTPNFCGPFAWAPTNTGLSLFATSVRTVPSTLWMAIAAGAAGTGSSVRSMMHVTSPTTSPTLEAVVSLNPAQATSTIVMVGFTGNAATANPVIGREPVNGIYFIASSTAGVGVTGGGANWWAVVKQGANRTAMDTGIASSTNDAGTPTPTATSTAQRLRIEVTPTNVTFLINGNVVAASTTGSVNADYAVNVSLAGSINGTLSQPQIGRANFGLRSLRVWDDDPPESKQLAAGPDSLAAPENETFDWDGGSNFSVSYLFNEQEPERGAANGKIARIDPATTSAVKFARQPYDKDLLGVVVNASMNTVGYQYAGKTTLIATQGRVPLQIVSENGGIRAGDPITSSSFAGYGMKATRPGYIIGRALESFELSTSTQECSSVEGTTTPVCAGTILIALSPEYALNFDAMIDVFGESATELTGEVAADLAEALNVLADDAFSKAVQFASLVAERVVAKMGIFERLFAKTIYAENIYADTVNAKTLCLDGLCITKDQLHAILNGQVAGSSTTTPSGSAPPPQEKEPDPASTASTTPSMGTTTPPGDGGDGSEAPPEGPPAEVQSEEGPAEDPPTENPPSEESPTEEPPVEELPQESETESPPPVDGGDEGGEN
ncbi:MAG: hypothetical protein WA021_03440, partial [Minisyncoccia bacterium]